MTTEQHTTLKHLELPEMPYAYEALEPHISGEIMRLHHTKHHQAYINNFNAALDKLNVCVSGGDLAGALALHDALRFNGGGYLNHAIFWTNLAPVSNGGGQAPTGALADAIDQEFGSLNEFIAAFNSKAAPIQGSGWCWLGYDKTKNRLVLATCSNQDPLSNQGYVPLLGVDMWEHAYYLQYKGARPEYLKAIWNVVNWKNVAERFQAARS